MPSATSWEPLNGAVIPSEGFVEPSIRYYIRNSRSSSLNFSRTVKLPSLLHVPVTLRRF